MLDMEDCDEDASISMTWSIDPSGTMRHKQTGIKISEESGIAIGGHEYLLKPSDIEMAENGVLGSGACGVVMRGTIKKSGQLVAIKTVKVDEKAKREQLLNEIQALVSVEGCQNLVQWYAGFVNKKTNCVHVVLEFMDRGSLADLKKRVVQCGSVVPPPQLAEISRQIMTGLDHLHDRHLLHRDIKPENILHNNLGEVKLTDFGIAKDLDTTLAVAGTFVGTVTYMSPERALGEDYSLASDIWSVGMVLYELASGVYPFKDFTTFPALFENLIDKPEPRLEVAYPNHFPPELCEFVARCLTRDLKYRPEAKRLLQEKFVVPGASACSPCSQAELVVFFQQVDASCGR